MRKVQVGDRVEWTGEKEPPLSNHGRVTTIFFNHATVMNGPELIGGIHLTVHGTIPIGSLWRLRNNV